jgi:hypothetical protein
MIPDPVPHWRALRPGYFELKKEALNVHLVKCEDLPIPSGRLIIKDANGFGRGPQRAIPVIPGTYPMTATCVEQGQVSMLAYISIEMSSAPVYAWKLLTPIHKNEQEMDIAERLRGGFLNRSAYGLMVDEDLMKNGLPIEDEHCYSMLCYWQNRIEDTKPVWEGGRYALDTQKEEKPVVIFKTRMMTGLTRIYGELDGMGFITRLHVDLGLMERLYKAGESETETP